MLQVALPKEVRPYSLTTSSTAVSSQMLTTIVFTGTESIITGSRDCKVRKAGDCGRGTEGYVCQTGRAGGMGRRVRLELGYMTLLWLELECWRFFILISEKNL